jgi:hypothetical protein
MAEQKNLTKNLTLVLERKHKDALESLALEFVEPWGKRGNVKGLIEKLALHELHIIDVEEVEILVQCARSLVNIGQIATALKLIKILLRCQGLPMHLIEELEMLSDSASRNIENEYFWKVRELILKRIPFKLLYQKGGGEIDTYTIRYAHLEPTPEERIPFYLCAWVDKPSSHPEMKGLEHNRSFRFDRILEVISLPKEEWRHQGLDLVEVKFLLRGSLAKSYQAKKWDIDSQVTDKGRLVRRQVWSLWWFVNRDILRYGSRTVVLSPPEARKMVIDELEAMTKGYAEEVEL